MRLIVDSPQPPQAGHALVAIRQRILVPRDLTEMPGVVEADPCARPLVSRLLGAPQGSLEARLVPSVPRDHTLEPCHSGLVPELGCRLKGALEVSHAVFLLPLGSLPARQALER